MPRLDLAVALGVGVGGALVDVSSYARLTDGLSRRWGRTDAFYGVEPGTFSFVLDNGDGRFTPENPNSPLDTTLTEGMAACVQVGSRLTAGVVRSIEPEFPSGEAAWSRVRVTCGDALGELARVNIDDPTRALALGVGAGGFWPFSDTQGSPFAFDVSGAAQPFPAGGAFTLGAEGTAPGGGTQATFAAPAAAAYQTALVGFPELPFNSLSGQGTNVSVWLTPNNTTSFLEFLVRTQAVGSGSGVEFRFGVQNDRFAFWTGASYATSAPFIAGDAHFLSAAWALGTFTFAVNGVTVATYVDFATAGQTFATITVGDAAYGVSSVNVANLAVTIDPISAYTFVSGTPTQTFDALGNIGTYPTSAVDLSTAPLNSESIAGGSVLDALNLLATTEQGYLYATTSGSLTSPTQTVNLRGRDRPETITESFNVEDELQGAPAFVRDITNLVSTVNVNGPGDTTIVTDSALVARAGSASSSDETLLTRRVDRRAWGQDRLIRGANTKMQIASVVVDAMTTPTDRNADLLALIPGDRVQFTGLPETQLGFDTWDGWFLGATETHTLTEHSFELHFQPVLPPTAKYDTATYMASGELTLNGAINSAVTSISVESTGALLSTTAVPYVMQIDDEQLTVTAVVGATSPQTVTVTRAANGTTAASHADNAVLVGPIPESIYAF